MAYVTIPVRCDIPAYEFQLTLEGVVYNFAFYYNRRADKWSMDILDVNSLPICMGISLVAGVVLTNRFQIAGQPPGNFVLVDSEDGTVDPGVNDLGTRFSLVYRESTTPNGQ